MDNHCVKIFNKCLEMYTLPSQDADIDTMTIFIIYQATPN